MLCITLACFTKDNKNTTKLWIISMNSFKLILISHQSIMPREWSTTNSKTMPILTPNSVEPLNWIKIIQCFTTTEAAVLKICKSMSSPSLTLCNHLPSILTIQLPTPTLDWSIVKCKSFPRLFNILPSKLNLMQTAVKAIHTELTVMCAMVFTMRP